MIAEGYALEAETRWEAAAEWYRKAMAVDHAVIPLVLLGRCLRSGGHADEGLAKLREATKQDPKSLFASFELGKALLADRPDDPEGGTLMQRVAQGEPKSWEPKYFLAKVAFAEGNSDQAAEQARAAIQANPNQASPHYLLWQILKKRGETSQAEIELAKFRQLQSQTYAQATEDLKRVFAQ
jgi:cytochrome c-type biogenesis protein CcmH/NrfG